MASITKFVSLHFLREEKSKNWQKKTEDPWIELMEKKFIEKSREK
jgi:hypothetical protein